MEQDEKVEHVLLQLRNMLVAFIESCFFKHFPMTWMKKACILNKEKEDSHLVSGSVRLI